MELDVRHYTSLLQSCNTESCIYRGKQIHLLFLKKGFLRSCLTIANRFIQMYSRCGSICDARTVFEEMPDRNSFSWNAMIEGYVKCSNHEKAVEMFDVMPERNDFSWNLVISGFAKSGEMDFARRLFNDMPVKNAVAWNSMIRGYARNGYPLEALRLFKEFSSCRDMFVFATVIRACTDLQAVEFGKQIHSRILINGVEFDSVMGSSLVNLYAKCGDLGFANNMLCLMKEPDDFSLSALISGYAECGRITDARRIFYGKRNLCSVIWNSMISGYIYNNLELEALILYNEMRNNGVRGDPSTIASVLSACSGLGLLENGKQLHSHAYKLGALDDIVVASSLLDTYSKCGSFSDACRLFSQLKTHDTILLNSMIKVYSSCGRIEEAKEIFKNMSNKSLVSWNSMIVGLSQNGCPIDALDLFREMNNLNLRMDKFSLASVISACASISQLELGEQVFARSLIIGLESDQIISSSLIDFYCKCGFVEYGRKVFDLMVKLDEIPWNSMLIGYATNGRGCEALAFFRDMREAGIKPNSITFTGVLSACDHCGLFEEGRKWFDAMKWDYHIDPGIEHYSCMVDLFARAGCIQEAIDLIKNMPFKPDASMWSSVLRGCVAHGDKATGQKVAEKIMELEPDNSGAYVQLSSILASSGEWDGSALVRQLMRDKQVKKNPGSSWADF